MKKQITFKIEAKEKEALRKLARERGLPLASFCRWVALSFLKDTGVSHG